MITLVLAIADNGVIGNAGAIPWRLPDDMRRFKALTLGHTVVMGRKTWDSLPAKNRPLPGRRNLVVTRDADWHAQGAERVALDAALAGGDAFVIGGAEIYRAALPHADRIELTEVHGEVAKTMAARMVWPTASSRWSAPKPASVQTRSPAAARRRHSGARRAAASPDAAGSCPIAAG